MQEVPDAVLATTSLDSLVARFSQRDISALPVVEARGQYVGVVSAADVDAALRDSAGDFTAGDLADMPSTLSPDASLDSALTQFVQQNTSALPVEDKAASTIVGWLTHRDILVAYEAHTRATGSNSGRNLSAALKPEFGR